MATYFCTSCGNAQSKVGKFCTSCGAAIDANAVKTTTSGRTSSTTRLAEGVAGVVSGDLGSTVADGGASRSGATPGVRRSWRPRIHFNTWLLVSSLGMLLVVVAIATAWMQGLLPTYVGGRPEIDRVVAVTEGQDGATTMVLMTSDGRFKVTLVDVPGFSSSSQYDSLSYFPITMVRTDEHTMNFSHAYGTDLRGAAVLAYQRRILYWYPTVDGMELYSVDLDGGDQVRLVQGQVIRSLTIAEQGNQLLLVTDFQPIDPRQQTSGREPTSTLSLLDLRGQTTPIVQNVLSVGGTLSPDGNHLVYWVEDEDHHFTLTAADGTGTHPVEIARDLTSASAHYASDSSKLFINRSDAQGSIFQVAEVNGQQPVTLSRSSGYGSGDVANNRLIYTVTSNNETNLFTCDLSGDDRVEIVRGTDSLGWHLTPDRTKLIYTVSRNGRTSVQTSDLKHEQAEEIKRSDGTSLNGLAIENDRVLILRSPDSESVYTISTIKLDGSDEQMLKRTGGISGIDMRGESILVTGEENDRSMLYLVGGDEPIVLDDEADSYSRAYLTPKDQIIYTAHFDSGPVIYTIDSDGKQRKMLLDNAEIVAAGF